MSEEKNIQERVGEQYIPHLIRFKQPYRFEGQEYEELDLSGLERMTVKDAIDAQKKLFEQQEEATLLLTETTTAFARMVAAKASGKPVEFFQQMPRGSGKLVSNAVKAYLNGVADLSSMHESHAENRMAREGFLVTENSFNFLYACVIASMATGLPEEFFTALPLKEAVKLKNAVNDADFFG